MASSDEGEEDEASGWRRLMRTAPTKDAGLDHLQQQWLSYKSGLHDRSADDWRDGGGGVGDDDDSDAEAYGMQADDGGDDDFYY